MKGCASCTTTTTCSSATYGTGLLNGWYVTANTTTPGGECAANCV